MHWGGAGVLALFLLVCTGHAQEAAVDLLRTDSRSPYVHRLTLYDHDGVAIDPRDPFAGPYSPRATCGKCHDYGAIGSGWHFNAPTTKFPPGRPWEPWLLANAPDQPPIALSGRPWPGTVSPAAAGLSHWQFVKRFGHHLPGGGYGEPTAAEVVASPEAVRWRISGPLEIDCMFCHAADLQHDPGEAARQIEAENFKWAATAALGLAVIRGEARRAPDDWDPLMPPSPDHPELAGPQLVWDLTRFDPNDRVLFDITRRPPNERCYYCHTVRPVGPGAPEPLVTHADVHLAAGLLCVDCHRNGIDHQIVRGYDDEAGERAESWRAVFSCAGCHLGAPDPQNPNLALGGRYGAPHPQHRGLPPLHFERMSCTACHSGPWPEDAPQQFQTALAHGLGLATRDRTDSQPPAIVGPIFAEQADGKIAPQRAIWTKPPEGAAAAYRYSIAHDVRPASQSLGINGCADCHSTAAPIYFGRVWPEGAAPGGAPTDELMWHVRGDDDRLASVWGVMFGWRPPFKIFGIACGLIIALIVLRDMLRGFQEPRVEFPRLRGLSAAFGALAASGAVLQFISGFVVAWITGEFGGYALLAHMTGAGLFVFGITGVAVLWAPGQRLDDGASGLQIIQRLLFWIGLTAAAVVISTMLAAMLPFFGYATQEGLVEAHEVSAIVFLLALVAYALCCWFARQRMKAVTS